MAGETAAGRAALEARQWEQLRALLEAVGKSNPFYRRKLGAALERFAPSSLGEFSARVPFTTKQELAEDQRAHPPCGTNLTFPLERYTRFHQTSGTSGTPLRWLDTPESWDWMLGNWAEVFRAAGVTRADRVFFAFSFGPFLGFWTAFEAAARLGCLCLPGGGLSSAARLRVLIENGATVLCSTPTYAIRLAEVAAEEKIDLHASRVRRIIVAGEAGGSVPATRARIEQLWPGVRVFDHHGMTEVGPVSYECPAQPGVLHVIEASYFAEVLEPGANRVVPAGEVGELVLTTLGRVGSPLLRYRTGDLVKPAEWQTCACGSNNLALKGGILGRVDDMIVVRGVNVYPSAVEEIIRRCEEVAEYRVHLSRAGALAEMKIEVEPAPGCANPGALCAKLEKAFQESLALRVPVSAVPVGSLPRFELKARRWQRD